MSWILALYVWGIGASAIINTTKSALGYWYIKTEDKNYYDEYKSKSSEEKTLFYVGNILKMFIPVYNIIHPIKMLLDSPLPSLIHPIKSLKQSGRRQVALWNYQNAKRTKRINKLVSLFQKKTKKNEKVETKEEVKTPEVKKEINKEVKTEEKVPVKNVVKTKPVVKTETPKVNTATPSTFTIEEIDEKINELRKQYNCLKSRYDILKSKNASTKDLNEIAIKMNKICETTNALIKRRKQLKNLTNNDSINQSRTLRR